MENAPHNWKKNLNWVRVYVCVCVCVFVWGEGVWVWVWVWVCVHLSKESFFLSWNICHCSSAISGNKFFDLERYVYCQCTPVSVSRAWEGLLLLPVKILISREPQAEYVRTKWQRASQLHTAWDFFFLCVLGLRIIQKRTFKIHLEGTEIAACYGYKEWYKLRCFNSS